MNTLKIQNTSGITENIKYKTINKLYDLLKNITLTNSHSLQGRLEAIHAHKTPVMFLTQNFNKLFINITDEYYIEFSDNNVKKMMSELYGDSYGEVILSNVNVTSLSDTFSKSKMQQTFSEEDGDWEIISFNELSQFTQINKLNQSVFQNQTELLSVDLTNITQLGKLNFSGCTKLNNLGDTSNITSISGEENFKNCSSLTSFNISPNLKTINTSTFRYCTNLTEIDLTNVETINNNAFEECNITGELRLPNIVSLGGEAFKNCKNITSITDLGTLTTFKEAAYGGTGYGPFIGCSGLISVILPETLTSIVRHSFIGCTSLTTVFGGENVTVIKDNAFQGCTSLENVEFNFNNITTINHGVFDGCQNLSIETLSLPNITGELGGISFRDCKKLKYINNLGECSSFGSRYNGGTMYGPFTNCTSLISVNLPPTLTTLGKGAFYNCTSLTTIDLTYITIIDEFAFQHCTSLTTINNSNNVVSINYKAFIDCISLTNIDTSNVETINSNAFKNCTLLSNINVLKVKTLGSNSFENSGVNGGKLIFRDILSIGASSFYNSKYSYLEFGENLTSISSAAFWNSPNLTTLVFRSIVPPTYTDASNRVFLYNMTNLTIYVPDQSINDYKTASDLWSRMADNIKGISELPTS